MTRFGLARLRNDALHASPWKRRLFASGRWIADYKQFRMFDLKKAVAAAPAPGASPHIVRDF
jgi:hypothetical protein